MHIHVKITGTKSGIVALSVDTTILIESLLSTYLPPLPTRRRANPTHL